MPRIQLLGASLEPVIEVQVTSEQDAVLLQATDCQLNATGIMGGLDSKFALQVRYPTWHAVTAVCTTLVTCQPKQAALQQYFSTVHLAGAAAYQGAAPTAGAFDLLSDLCNRHTHTWNRQPVAPPLTMAVVRPHHAAA